VNCWVLCVVLAAGSAISQSCDWSNWRFLFPPHGNACY